MQQNVTFTTNAAGGLSIGGVISGAGVGITKAGLGTLTLTGANAYTGATNVAGGAIVLDFAHSSAAAGGIIGSISGAYSALNLTGGSITVIGKASEADKQTFSGLTVGNTTAGSPGVAATIAVTTGGGVGASVGLNVGAIAVNIGSTLNIAPGAGVTLTTSTNNVISGILGGGAFYTSGASANDFATSLTGGQIGALPSSGYTAKIGTVQSIQASDANKIISFNGANFSNTVDVPSGTTVVDGLRFQVALAARDNGLSLGGNVLVVSDNGQSTGVGGVIVSSIANGFTQTISGDVGGGITGGKELVFQVNPSQQLVVKAPIIDNGASNPLAVVVSGGGTTTFSGTNAYTGNTYINGGTLFITSNVALGQQSTAAPLLLNSGVVNAATTMTLDNNGSNARSIVLGVGGGGLGAINGASLTIDGVISGAGGLTKIDSGGTMTLSGVNTYQGGTTLASGVLVVTNEAVNGTSGSLGAAPSSAATSLTFSGTSNAATLQFATSGLTVHANRGMFVASSFAATLDTQSNSETIAGAISIAAGGNLTKLGSGTLSLTGVISGAGSMIASSGSLVLSGANSYLGGTTINAATVQIQSANNLGTGNVTISGGTLRVTNSTTLGQAFYLGAATSGANTIAVDGQQVVTLSAAIHDASATVFTKGLTFNGPGTLLLQASSDYSHGTTIAGGIVQISSNANLGTGAITLSGGTLEVLASAGTINSTRTVFVAASNATSQLLVDSGAIYNLNGAVVGGGALNIDHGARTSLGGNFNGFTGTLQALEGDLNVTSVTGLGASETVTLHGNSLIISDALGALNLGSLNGDGTLKLGVNDTLSIGAMSGTLSAMLGSNSTLKIGDSGSHVVTGTFGLASGASNISLTKMGAGALSWNGAITNTTISVAAGTLSLRLGSTGTSLATDKVLLTGGVLRFANDGTTSTSTLITLTLGAGQSGIAVSNLASNAAVTLSSALSLNVSYLTSSFLTVTSDRDNSLGAGNAAGAFNVTFSSVSAPLRSDNSNGSTSWGSPNAPIIPFAIYMGPSGASFLTCDTGGVNGSGAGLRPLTTNEYVTSITAGDNVVLANNGNTVGANTSILSLLVSATGASSHTVLTIADGSTLTLQSQLLAFAGTNNVIAPSGSTGALTFNTANALTGKIGTIFTATGTNNTIAAVINGGVAWVKAGGGQLNLTATNSYTQGTYLESGTVGVLNRASLSPGNTTTTFTGDAAIKYLASLTANLTKLEAGKTFVVNPGVVGTFDASGQSEWFSSNFSVSGTMAIAGGTFVLTQSSGSVAKIELNPNAIGGASAFNPSSLLRIDAGTLQLATVSSASVAQIQHGTIAINPQGALSVGIGSATVLPLVQDALALNGGTMTFTLASATALTMPLSQPISLNYGDTTWSVSNTAAAVTVSASQLNRPSPGAVLTYKLSGATSLGAGNVASAFNVTFASPPTPNNGGYVSGVPTNGVQGIVPGVFVSSGTTLSLTTYIAGANSPGLRALTASDSLQVTTTWPTVAAGSGSTGWSNLTLNNAATVNVTADATVNSLLMNGAGNLDLQGKTLTVMGGVVANAGIGSNVAITNGYLTFGSGDSFVVNGVTYNEGIVYTNPAATATTSINVTVTDADNPVTLVIDSSGHTTVLDTNGVLANTGGVIVTGQNTTFQLQNPNNPSAMASGITFAGAGSTLALRGPTAGNTYNWFVPYISTAVAAGLTGSPSASGAILTSTNASGILNLGGVGEISTTFSGSFKDGASAPLGVNVNFVSPLTTLTLTGDSMTTNSFSGGLTLTSGIVAVANPVALGGNAANLDNATVTFAGGTLKIVGTSFDDASHRFAIKDNGTIDITDAAATLEKGTQNLTGFTGHLTITGPGTLTLTGAVAAHTGGTSVVSGATLRATSSSGLTGDLTVSGNSTAIINGTMLGNGAVMLTTNGTLNISNTAQVIRSLSGDSTSIVTGSGATLTISNSTAETTTFDGRITGDISLVFHGVAGSAQVLNDFESDYIRTTEIDSGKLIVNGSIVNNGGASTLVTVNSGGALAGTGVIERNVTVASGGTISPGSSDGQPATLTIGESSTPTVLAIQGVYAWDLKVDDVTQSNSASSSDLISLLGSNQTLTLGAGSVLSIALASTPDSSDFWTMSHVWNLVTGIALATSGTFDTLTDGTRSSNVNHLGGYLGANGYFAVDYSNTDAVRLDWIVTSVPEPGTLLLSVVAATGVGARLLRRRRAIRTNRSRTPR